MGCLTVLNLPILLASPNIPCVQDMVLRTQYWIENVILMHSSNKHAIYPPINAPLCCFFKKKNALRLALYRRSSLTPSCTVPFLFIIRHVHHAYTRIPIVVVIVL